ncbi:MAG: superoxide dismutase family protein [Betaproteobacteria bacterium]
MHLNTLFCRTRYLVLIGCASAAGCATLGLAEGPKAIAVIAPTSAAASAGMNPQGTVSFTERGDVLVISGRITGLRPGQAHGFHVHEASDCSGDGMATKGHFNPFGVAHGKHGDHVHHAGDLPSLKADASGVAEFKAEIKQLRVSPGPASVVGRGLIVHRDPDDYKTQPTGNAGPRPGCAAIRPAT